MARYTVTGLVDATVHAEVEAATPEEAAENAELYAGVCHQCANELEVGDVVEVRVSDASGKEVYRDRNDEASDVRVLARYLKGKAQLPPAIAKTVSRYA